MNHKINVNTYHIFHTARSYPQFIKLNFTLFKGRVTFFDPLLLWQGHKITANNINDTY